MLFLDEEPVHLRKHLRWMVIGLVVNGWVTHAKGDTSASPTLLRDAIAPSTPAWQTRETVEHANAVAESFMNSLLIADSDAKSAFLAKRPGFSQVISAYQQKNYAQESPHSTTIFSQKFAISRSTASIRDGLDRLWVPTPRA